MKKIINKVKGFTLTELAIVIAVIAILIAVLVPTFIALINKANESNDMVLVSNLNTSLSIAGEPDKVTVENKDNTEVSVYNVTTAITSVRGDGYDVSKLTPTSDSGDIVYNATTNKFVYYADDFTDLAYGEVNTGDVLVVVDADLNRVGIAEDVLDNTIQYCVYSEEAVSISTSANISIWVYTESGTSTIAATQSVIYRYGTGEKDEAAVDENSYHLYGKVDTIVLSQGHLDVKNENSVKDVILEVSTTDNQPYVTGSAVEYLVIDTTSGTKYTKENDNKVTTANPPIKKDENLKDIVGYGTSTNPYVATSTDELKTILGSDYSNVTFTIAETSSTVTATKSGDNVKISGELSEKYYAAISGSVTLADEYRQLITSSGSSSVTLVYAVESAEARIGEVYYDEFILIDASTETNKTELTSLTFGSTGSKTSITLLNNVELSQVITIASYADVSLDLNGYKLAIKSSSTTKGIELQTGATFTVDDNSESQEGTLSLDSTSKCEGFIYTNASDTTFNLNGGILENNLNNKVTISIAKKGTNSTFNMTGGTISTPNGYSNTNGIIYACTVTATINISGGSISNDDSTQTGKNTIYVIGATVTITGGNISGGQAICAINGADVSISGGSISGSSYAIYSSRTTSTLGNPTINTTINISGGKLSGETYSVYCSSYTDVAVTGGTVNSIYLESDTSSAIVPNTGTETNYNSTTTVSMNNGYTPSVTATSSTVSYTVTVTEDKAYAYIIRDDVNLYYVSLSAAIAAAKDGETIYMSEDCSSSISTNKTITIDLNGYNISSDDNAVSVFAGGNLTLINSNTETKSTIKTTSTSSTVSRYALIVYPGATLTLDKNITATSDGDWTAFVGENYSTDTYDTIATLNVKGTITNTNSNGIAILGYGNDLVGGTVINIYEGAVIESAGLGIYHPQVGTLNIYGGTISGVTGIEMRSGTLNVEGGTIKSTATEFSVNANGSGSTVYGAAIAISQHSTQKAITVTISGGTISGYYALYETDTVATTTLSENVNITISGTATLTSTANDATNGYYSANNKVTDNRSK